MCWPRAMAASTDNTLRQLRRDLAAQVAGRPLPPPSAGRAVGARDSVGLDELLQVQAHQAIDDVPPIDLECPPIDLEWVRARLTDQPALMRSLLALDESQRAAVVAPARATLVRAPVGSGKTTVLAHRVLWLRHAVGVPLGRIAALTFTQAAAQELVGRVSALVQDPGPDDGFDWFGTFHGVARAALARNGHPRGGGLQVCDESRGRAVLTQVAARARLGKRELAAAWDDLGLARRGATQGWPADRVERTQALLRAYRAALADLSLLDFDGLLEACAAWASTAPDAQLPLWLVVDELQDCNELELQTLSALRRAHTGLFAVGDPDQAIYGWRGGRGDVFEHLAQSWPATALSLHHNYRSTPEIGRAAVAVLGQAARPVVQHQRRSGPPIAVHRHVHAQMEGLYLVDRLRSLYGAGVPWHRTAVLARTREQLAAVRTVLGDAGVPCWSAARAQSWPDRPAAHWLLQVLACCDGTSVGGALALRSVLASRPFAAGALSVWPVAALRKAATADPGALAVALCAKVAKEERARRWLLALVGLDAALPPRSQDCAARAEILLDLSAQLHPSHRDHARHLEHARGAVQQVATLRAQSGLTWFAAARLVLADQPQADAARTTQEGVALHTFHAAKGLEFDHVFISGCNQGVVPLAKAFADRAQWAEERRLLYVAMTRARDTLELSWHAQPPIRGGMPMPSEWLLALPAEVTRWVETQPSAAPLAAVAGAQPQPVVEADTAQNELSWPVGVAVRHAKYGQGLVTRSDDTQVHATFGKLGEKSFSLLLCPLERVG